MLKRILGVLSLVSVLTVLLAISPAAAEKPVERVKFTDEFSDIDEDFAAGCGVATVLVDVKVKVQLNFFEDGSLRGHENGKITFTNPDTADQVFLSFSDTFFDEPVMETFDDPLLTLVFETTVIGNPQMWRAPGIGVIVRDAGRITIRATVVIDTTIVEGDPVVDFSQEIVDQSGPHPFADQGFFFDEEQLDVLCDAIGGSVQ